MTDITNIPLNKLTAWEGNVRKTQTKGGIDDLAASIKAHGLLQSLVVRPHGKKFAVAAGGRRLKALQQLAANGDIPADYPVPCKVTDTGTDASELSLAENVMRENMHPADQFEAFRDLIDKGMPMADIAARFSVSEHTVKQRLALARVSPLVLKAYRDEELTLEDVMAFAVTNDHEAQEHVLSELEQHHGPRDIREALTENEIPATDILERLLENGRKQEPVRGTDDEIDFHPVVKLFTPDAACTWLLSEIDPENPDLAFGLCDLGMGFPELGSVSLAELEGVRGRLGLPVERDLFFRAEKPLSAYATEATRFGFIKA